MKHLKSFNESRIYGYEVLPQEALVELEMYVDYKDKSNNQVPEALNKKIEGGPYQVAINIEYPKTIIK
jgi:hypothetical protein